MTKDRARELRRKMTPPERRLWNVLKARPEGFTFRRQHALDPYILDLFCHEAGLAIEIDGFSHELGNNPQYDQRRDKWVAELGVRTVRIAAIDVRDNLEGVVMHILEQCRRRSLTIQESPSTAFGGPPPLQMQGR